jgi:hypothetical protein
MVRMLFPDEPEICDLGADKLVFVVGETRGLPSRESTAYRGIGIKDS